MADFTGDGGGGGSVPAVYLQMNGADTLEIFPTSYNIKDSCKMLGSPSEGGLTQYDNKVTQPREVTFTGILKKDNFSTISAIREIVDDTDLGTILCTFYGKGGSVEKMVIESFEEIGTSNRYDAVEVKFVLREYLEHNSD